jgi:subtilisin family serine protease
MKRKVRFGAVLFSVAALLGAIGLVATMAMEGQEGGSRVIDVSGLRVGPGEVVGGVKPVRFRAKGEIEVAVRLVDAPLAVAHGRNAKQKGGALDKAQQRAHLDLLARKQDALMGKIRGLGGRELGRVSKALNAVFLSIDASRIKEVAAMPGVLSIRPIRNYEISLSDTVPYIGASAVHAAGFDGAGVRVAVLDSGIDYTHANFGGPGTAAAYAAAYGSTTSDPLNTTLDGLFPTAKVVGGFDFVGEVWPTGPLGFSGPLAPDPDPIDCGPAAIPAPCSGSHGSHVADIIGGNDGVAHKGVAPGASLYAVKVCSAVSTSCSGIALLNGMDFALDPNGDGDISDAVDVVNMSLGSPYGQVEDDLSEASANAVRLGVVVVTSAGNRADRPYITGSPGSTPEVISVAQTQVPSAKIDLMTISPDNRNLLAVFQPWATPPAGVIAAPVQYGDGAGGNLNGCAPFPAGSLAGKIVLVDRGACFFSDKIRNVELGGGLVGVIGLVAPGAPFPGGFGGGPPISIPGYMISQADSNLTKSRLGAGVVATFDPNNILSLAGSMVSSSSRGPNVSFNAIKPDIGAPGASISAEAGTGIGSTGFGGTSGAAPMVAGSAALLLDAHPARTPSEIKALLMNTAETNVQIDPTTLTGELAPITRIGGGEVRVDRALDGTTAAWDDDNQAGSLSFGYHSLTGTRTFNKKVRVRNYSGTARTYSITPGFRYANDAASGAVTLNAPASIVVPANGSRTFRVQLRVDPSLLPIWTLNGGSSGGDGFRLQGVEFDGYIGIADATDNLNVAWHILPHRAAAVTPAATNVTLAGGTGTVDLSNATGAVDGRVSTFSLLGTSGKIPPKFLPEPGDSFTITDLRAVGARLVGIGGGAFGVQFAVNTFGARAHPNYPAEFDVYIDNDLDGVFDFVVFNRENGSFASTGQNLTAIFDLTTFALSAFFFTDADLDSANAILTAPLFALGLTPGTQFSFSVFGCDNYFTGACTDAIQGMTYTLGTPRFFGTGIPGSGVPAGGGSTLTINAVPGGDVASPSQTGLLLMLRDSKSQQEASQIRVF